MRIESTLRQSGHSDPALHVSTEKNPTRLDSVDLLRGLVMIVMALDHVRDYFTNVRFYPLDLDQTTVALALTRWITHFCAPVFVFLAGTGAFLSLARGKTPRDLAWFLLTRGLWLLVLEVTVVRFGWVFNLDYTFAFGQVIWAIGWSMVVLAGLVRLPVGWSTAFGVLMILSHNAFDAVVPESFGPFGWIWKMLHAGGDVEYAAGYRFAFAYPLIPWIGVMAAGYGFGRILRFDTPRRKRTLLLVGIGLTATFVVLRAINMYGDPGPWSHQKDAVFTVLSFLNCEKYPPSLLYLLMTLGPAIALLPLLERWKGKTADFVVTFGRVPMFFYLIHIYVIHASAVLTGLVAGYDVSFMFANVPPWEWPEGWGYSLPVVYAVWIVVILALYPLCRWYAGLKKRTRSPLLSYL